MFSKLLKWDFRNHLSSLLIMALSSLATLIFVFVSKLDIDVLSMITLFIAVMGTFAAMAFTNLRIPYLTAKEIYSKVGFRTNMIPVKTSTLWHSKIIVGFIFTLLSVGLFFLNFSILSYFSADSSGDFFAAISETFNNFSSDIGILLGVSQGLGKVILVGFSLLTILFLQFSFGFYVALANSKFFRGQGVIRYLLAYVLYYLGFQVIGLIGLFLFPINVMLKEVDGVTKLVPVFKSFISQFSVKLFDNGLPIQDYFFPLGVFITVFIMLIAQYFITKRMMDKNLNL